jgi:hypothetical protein
MGWAKKKTEMKGERRPKPSRRRNPQMPESIPSASLHHHPASPSLSHLTPLFLKAQTGRTRMQRKKKKKKERKR